MFGDNDDVICTCCQDRSAPTLPLYESFQFDKVGIRFCYPFEQDSGHESFHKFFHPLAGSFLYMVYI